MRTISSLIDFFGAGNTENTIARVNLNKIILKINKQNIHLRYYNTIKTLKKTNRRHIKYSYNTRILYFLLTNEVVA